jgi:S-adenosylmethionine synthetase
MAKKVPNPIDKHVGSRVRMRRMMLSMSQEKLGDALGLTFQQVLVYQRVGFRRSSGQGLRPDFGRDPRRISSKTTSSSASPTTAGQYPARLRDALHHQQDRHRRRRPWRRRSSISIAKVVVNREALIARSRAMWSRTSATTRTASPIHGADVEVLLHGQSPDIAMGVDAKKKKSGDEEGAGDQGMMFGFACTESEVYEKGSFMPAPIYFAHKILKVLSDKRRSGQLFDLQPDAKSQVTVRYVNGKPVGCTKVVVSTQHNEKSRNGKKYTPGMVKEMIADAVESALPKGWMPQEGRPTSLSIRPATSWSAAPTAIAASPAARSSSTLTAATRRMAAALSPARIRPRWTARPPMPRAISPRTWSPPASPSAAPSRSPTRSALPIRCRSMVDTHGTGKVDEKASSRSSLPELFRLTPTNIRRTLKLNRPIYRRTAAYGHFGRAPDKDGGFSWEKTDLADLLYPDPWPKRRHWKRRFIQDDSLKRLARILKPGGELRFATDIADYAAYALARAQRSRDFIWTAECADDWRKPWAGFSRTRYEAKAIREGRSPAYFIFRRV